jgi:hypothetical protein
MDDCHDGGPPLYILVVILTGATRLSSPHRCIVYDDELMIDRRYSPIMKLWPKYVCFASRAVSQS